MSALDIPDDGELVFFAEGSDTAAASFANSTTYYAEIPLVAGALKTAVQEDHDATLVAALTLEFSNKKDVGFTIAAGRSWAAAPAAVPAVSIAGGSAGTSLGHYADNLAKRCRVKLAVTTGTTLAGLKVFAHHKQ